MDPVYYVKQKTFTVNAEPMGYRQTKNGKHQFYAKCAECGITKYRFVKKKKKKKKTGKLNGPSSGAGVLGTIAETGAEMFVKHGIPWMGKKAIEMGRYYGSEALRDPKLQKKVIDYALDKAKPLIHSVGVQALNQQSTKIRPDKKNKTDGPDLDGKGFKEHSKKGTREIVRDQKKCFRFCIRKVFRILQKS